MKLTKGENLTPSQVAEVKRAFIYRYTVDNPNTAAMKLTRAYDDGATQTDAEWIAEHAFYIRKDGRLSQKHNHCEPAFLAD